METAYPNVLNYMSISSAKQQIGENKKKDSHATSKDALRLTASPR